jgi:HTH domain
MNRTDRLLAIVLELQAAGWQRAEDLAARFEITKRTVYRDIQGIGEWSADFILLRGLGRMQQLHFTPATIFERRMSTAASRVYPSGPGRALSGREMRPLAERYGDAQGYWALYLRTGESAGWSLHWPEKLARPI